MKLITSCFSGAIIKNDIKRFKWLSFLYFVVLFFMYPFDLINSISLLKKDIIRYGEDVSYSLRWVFSKDEAYVFLIFGAALLMAVLLCRYLQNIKASTNIHSRPISRVQMYNSHVLAGLLLIVVPIVLIGVISIGIVNIYEVQQYMHKFSIWNWTLQSLVIIFVIYMLTIFIGIITGMSLSQGIISFILTFFPLGIGGLLIFTAEKWLYGFTYDNNLFNKLEDVSPGVLATGIEDKIFVSWQFTTMIVLGLIFYALGLILYKIRNNEEATNVIAFPVLESIFKYCVTFCIMIVGALFLVESRVIRGTHSQLIIAYLIFATLSYFIIEMVIQKSFKIRKDAFKGYFFYLLIIGILILTVKFDLYGYVNRVPETSQIQAVYFSIDYSNMAKDNWLTNKSSIENVRNIHRQILDTEEKDTTKERYRRNKFVEYEEGTIISLDMKYKLNNNRVMSRTYEINSEKYKQLIKPIFETEEYKRMYFDIFDLDIDRADFIKLREYEINKELLINNKDEVREFINILKQEILDVTYEQKLEDNAWSNIKIVMDYSEQDMQNQTYNIYEERDKEYRKTYYYSFQKDYYKLEKWLIDKGYIKNARIIPEDFRYMEIQKYDNESGTIKRTIVKDKQLIEKILRKSGNNRKYSDDYSYAIDCYLNNDIRTELSVFVEDVPELKNLKYE